ALHQRRLPGAVGSDEADDLAIADIEVDVPQCFEAAEPDTDPLTCEDDRRLASNHRLRLLCAAMDGRPSGGICSPIFAEALDGPERIIGSGSYARPWMAATSAG